MTPIAAGIPRLVWASAAGLLLGIGVFLFATGASPWVAPVAVVLCLALALGQYVSWTLAFVGAIVVELVVVAVLVRVAPLLGIGLVPVCSVALVLLGGTGLALFAARAAPRVIGARRLAVVLAVLAGAVAFVAVVVSRAAEGSDFEWAMHNDAVWNLVTTRLMIADGGLDAAQRPNASPLTPGLLAIVAAVGRDAVAPGDLLAHDVTRFVTFWLFAALASGVLAALVGARAAVGASRPARWSAAAIAGVIPLTWFVFGFAADFGFYNATVAVLLLVASWLAWLENRGKPFHSAAILSLAAVCLLATWAPLAIVPLALAVVALTPRLLVVLRGPRRWRGLGLLVGALAPVPLYALLVTLPDLRREGAALAVDGGLMTFLPVQAVIIVAVCVAVVTVDATWRRRSLTLVGVVVVCLSGGVAEAYLVLQRLGTANLWGYYPAKFAWLLVSLLLVVLTAAVLGGLVQLRGRPVGAIGVGAVAILVSWSLMFQVPPPRGLATAVTPLEIAAQRGGAAPGIGAATLFALAQPGQRTLVLSYGDEAVDGFVNAWLLQLESTTAEDPVRLFSYILRPGDEQQACEAVRAWNGHVRVVTSDESLPERFAEECVDADVTVDVLPAPGS